MEKQFAINRYTGKRSSVVYKVWDPWEDRFGLAVDKESPLFKKSVEKLKKYLDEETRFKLNGLEVKIIKADTFRYEELIPMYQIVRTDCDFVMRERRTLEEIAVYLWVAALDGPCSHIVNY